MAVNGHCMCKAIKVTLTEQVSGCIFCHCDNCIRQGGGGGTYEVIVPEDSVQLEGPAKEYIDRNTDSGIPMYRYFCGDCGCPIYSATKKVPGKIFLKCGILDSFPKPNIELYCKNKQGWEGSVEGAVAWEKGIVRS